LTASTYAASETLPLRDAFAVLFFVSVGMMFDPHFLIEKPWMIAVALGIVLIGKPLAALGIVTLLGHPLRTGLTVALGLAQIGEFSFILADEAKTLHLLPEDLTLARHPDLSPATLARIIAAGGKIASSSEKASLLSECAPAAVSSPETRRAYLAAAQTIESSSENRRALSALLRPGIPADGVAAILAAAKRIDSSSQKSELLVQAATLPLDPAAFSAYIDCAAAIDSSSEKGRAIRALLAGGTWSPEQRKRILDFAEREISSSSERESVLHAAIAR